MGLGLLTTFSAVGLARFGYTLILPPMKEALGLSNTHAGALATGNLTGYLGLALIGGFLAAHFSPRRVIAIALFVVGLTLILTAAAQGFVAALFARTLTGLGPGAANVPIMALMAAWFAPKRRGMATGVAVVGSSVGLILAGPMIPWLINFSKTDGWRISWIVLGAITVAVSVLAALFLRDRPQDFGLEPIGAEAGSGELSEKALAQRSAETSAASAAAQSPASSGASSSPSWRDVYRSPVIRRLAVVYTTFGFAYIVYVTFFAKYLQSERGYTKEAAGRLWLVIGWLSLFCGVIWGWVSDVLGRRFALAIVLGIQAGAYLLIALVPGRAGILSSTVLFGVTAWSIPAIMAAACGDCLGPRLAPAALGFLTLFFGIGQALGPIAGGYIADLSGSLTPALAGAGVVSFVGAALSLFLPRHA